MGGSMNARRGEARPPSWPPERAGGAFRVGPGLWRLAAGLATTLLCATFALVGAAAPAGAVSVGTVTTVARGVGAATAISAGPDGNLWFTDGNFIGRITPAGAMSHFTDPSIEQPQGIAAGSDGNIWFTNQGVYPAGGSIGRITPAGVVSHFTDASIQQPTGIAAGPDGNLWYTDVGTNSIGRITPAGVVSHFTDASISYPWGIAAGPDGNLWFTNKDGGSIGRITPAGVVSHFTDSSISGPWGIAAGPDGNLWFTNKDGGSIGLITPAGVVSHFTDASISGPYGIAAGPDGNLWFTNSNNSIGRITPAGVVSNFADTGTDPPLFSPMGIAAGADGNIWFADFRSIRQITPSGALTNFPGVIDSPLGVAAGPDGNLWFTEDESIGRITPAGVVSRFAVSPYDVPLGIAAGPDGNLWFTNADTNSIGRITPAGVVSHFTDPSIDVPNGIAAGPDGNVWFTNQYGNSIGRITPAGVVSHFTDPSIDEPNGIAAGPDGNVWFTNQYGNSIGRITPAGVVSHFTDPSILYPQAIAAGPDGNLWFTNPFTATIGRITPAGVVSHFTDPSIDEPQAIAAGADGNLWFTVNPGTGVGGSIGRITPAGVLTTFPAPMISPSGIAPGPDGNMWVTGGDNSISTVATETVASVPGPPTGVSAVAGNGSATVSWSAPADDGGAPVTSYEVTSSPGGKSCAWSSGALSCVVSGLSNGTSYSFEVTAMNRVGPGPASAASPSVTPSAGSFFHALAPARILDSRPGAGNAGGFSTPWGTHTTRTVHVGGEGGVPLDAEAVVLNVTVADTTGSSYLTVWPKGQTQPTASNLNWVAGEVIPNAVTVKLGASGEVSILNWTGTADVIIDVSGYYDSTSGDGYTSLTPARILDSRPGAGNAGGFSTPWGTHTTRTVHVGGEGGVPLDAEAVVLNVTVADTTGSSYLTVWPKGQTQPTASNLNWVAGEVIPNAVTVKLGASGEVSVFNSSGNVDVIIDVAGYYQPGTGKLFHALAPARILDSRPGAGNTGGFSTPWGAHTTRTVHVGGEGGVPLDAEAVVLNVTVADTTGSSYLTVWPKGQTQPTASNLNWVAGEVIPNAVTAKLGTSGEVSVFNSSGNVDVIADVAGWFG